MRTLADRAGLPYTFGLRRFTRQDARPLLEAVSESAAELERWTNWYYPEYNLQDCRDWLDYCNTCWLDQSVFTFAIVDRESGALAGSAILNGINRIYKMGNIGYWVRSSQRGRGAAGAAARLIAGFGMDTLGLSRLEIVVAVENAASLRAAEKSGAKREGVLRKRIPLNDKIYDAVMFSLVREDLLNEPGLPAANPAPLQPLPARS